MENNLREVVGRIINEVGLATDQGRTDINLALEDALLPILKPVFNLQHLINLNRVQRNYPGIDLGDDHDRVCFQISATTTLEKVKKTLQIFIDKRYYNDFDELYVLVLVKKQSTYSQSATDRIVGDDFEFNTRQHIIDLGDVLKLVSGLRLTAQKSILREFKIILGDVIEYKSLQDTPIPISRELLTNLVDVVVPPFVYVGVVDIDEKNVLADAKLQLGANRNRYSKRSVVKMAMILNGVESLSWIFYDKRIFSFAPIEGSGIETIVDIGTLEKLNSSDLYDSGNESNLNLFQQLLGAEVEEQLSGKYVERDRKSRFFYFNPVKEGNKVRNEQWIGKKRAKRNVFEQVQQKKDPTKVAHCKHLSFRLSFMRFQQQWYVSIVPSWYYTYGGYKSKFHDQLLVTQKRLEYNNSVRNHVRFIAYFLKVLGEGGSSELKFGDVLKLDALFEGDEERTHHED